MRKKIDFCIKKAIMIVFAVILSFGMLFSMMGCSRADDAASQNDEVHHAVVVVGNTRYEPTFDISAFQNKIMSVASVPDSTCLIINADGNPAVIDKYTIPDPQKKISETKKKQRAGEYTSQIIGELSKIQPDDEEMDLLQAVSMAARDLRAYDSGKELYILSSGLSTCNLVDFTILGLEQDYSEEIVSKLKEELPDLSGVTVYWNGLGETCGEQHTLYESDRTILKNIWTAILEEAGAAELHFSSEIATDTSSKSEETPFVSLVPIVEPSADINADDLEKMELEEEGSDEAGKVIKLDNKKLQFQPDTSELIDRKEASNELSEIIKYLKGDSSRNVLLVGTTSSAGGNEESLQALSLKRCQTIRNVMMEAGVQKNQVECYGAGYQIAKEENLACLDTDTEGRLIEEKAKKNRNCYVFTNMNMKKAASIMEKAMTES